MQLKRALQELQAARQKMGGRGKEDKWTSTGDGGPAEGGVRHVGPGQRVEGASQEVAVGKNAVEAVQEEREAQVATSAAIGLDHKPQKARPLETGEASPSLETSAGRDPGAEEAARPRGPTYRSDEVMETTFPVHAGPVATGAAFHSVKKISIVSTDEDGTGRRETGTAGSLKETESLTLDSLPTEQTAACLSREPTLEAQGEQGGQASFTEGFRSVGKEEEAADPGRRKNFQMVGVNGGYESASSEDSSTAENVSDNESTESEYHEASDGLLAAPVSAAEPPVSPPTAAETSRPRVPPEREEIPEAKSPSMEQAGDPGKALSKELLSACHILQKYLENPDAHMDEEMKLAYTMVLHSWLRLSCHKDASPGWVSQHLAAFQAISPLLLEFIINMADANGNTALHYTVSHSNFPVVAELLKTGVCHVDQQNKAGYTAIMLTALAASRSDSDMGTILQLLERGNVNAKASQAGQTALMLAVSHGRLDMVRALLASGADVNVQDDDGSTALMCACEHSHAEIARLLLATPGCDVTLADHDGSTALSIALEAGQEDISTVLRAHLNAAKCSSAGTSPQGKGREVPEVAREAP